MTPTPQLVDDQTVNHKVSMLARMVPSFSCVLVMLGAVLSANLLMRVMQAIKAADDTGISAVSRGIVEADLPTIVALYLAVFVGFIGIVVIVIRAFMSTSTASPSAWFFLIAGGLSLIPLLLVWEAQSLLVEGMSVRNISQLASSIQLCLVFTMVTSAAFALVLLIVSVVPLPSVMRAKRKYASILVLVLMEIVMIGMAVAFQVRASRLQPKLERRRNSLTAA